MDKLTTDPALVEFKISKGKENLTRVIALWLVFGKVPGSQSWEADQGSLLKKMTFMLKRKGEQELTRLGYVYEGYSTEMENSR